jgi:predicted aldo/keto reductase-like oxidoreductase
MMHTYCTQCSECLDHCPNATDEPSALEITQAQLKATRADYHALVLENVKLSEQVKFWRAEARRRATTETDRSDG